MNEREIFNWENLCDIIRKLKNNRSDAPVTHAELAELLGPLFEVIQDMRPESKVDD